MNNIMNMSNFIAVDENSEGILGKLAYFTLGGLMVPKQTCIEIGQTLGMPRVKPSKESTANAFRCATSAVYDRVVTGAGSNRSIHRVYFRDNQSPDGLISRELIKETLDTESNCFSKLANVVMDKGTGAVSWDNFQYDPDVDVFSYKTRAEGLYALYQDCYNSSHIESIIGGLIVDMQATKINIHGRMYFVPRGQLQKLTVFEEYIEAIAQHNVNDGHITVNSMFVVDDERQREKMTDEFYAQYQEEIETYQEKVQHFITSGLKSKVILNRWMMKIDALRAKKQTYEQVFQNQLSKLDDDFRILQQQAEELQMRVLENEQDYDGQMKLSA